MKIKSIFISEVKSFFENLGFQYVKGFVPKFILVEPKFLVIESFNILEKTDRILGGKLSISYKAVEDIILEIQFPNHNFSSYLTKEDVFSTFGDRYGNLGIDNNMVIKSEDDIIFYSNKIKDYIETDGKAFIEKYSYLPNILAEMDRLESEGLTWNNRDKGILSGSLDAYFRGLIISKLCNDSNFNKKIEKMNIKFNQQGYEEWIPYYEKLKERLKTITPQFNVT